MKQESCCVFVVSEPQGLEEMSALHPPWVAQAAGSVGLPCEHSLHSQLKALENLAAVLGFSLLRTDLNCFSSGLLYK